LLFLLILWDGAPPGRAGNGAFLASFGGPGLNIAAAQYTGEAYTVDTAFTKGKAPFVLNLRRSYLIGEGSGIIVQIFPKAAFLYRILEALPAQDPVTFISHFSPSGFAWHCQASISLL
jgi:hypothetical protein